MITFSDFVGHEEAKLALILNAIDIHCGGVVFIGEKGSGKSTLARLFKDLIPEDTPFIELPLNLTEDRLLGSIDIEKTIKFNQRIFQPGILSKANGGVIYIDDINLLPLETATLVFEAQERGEILIEREGFTLRQPVRFIVIASMNPEEGNISSHLLDRFGMGVIWQGLKDKLQRIEVIKKVAFGGLQPNIPSKYSDLRLKEKISLARLCLENIVIPSAIKEYISQLCLAKNISGHRGDIYLTYAARAYAAYCEHNEVSKEHVDKVAPLVLTHRQRMLQEMEQKEDSHKSPYKNLPGNQEREQNNPDSGEDSKSGAGAVQEKTHKTEENDGGDGHHHWVESNPKEEIFEIGTTFKIKRMVFKKDRLDRNVSGRRTKTRVKDRGGKYIKSKFKRNNDIAIDATIRACAPFQSLRGRKDRLLIYEEDLRFKQRQRKMSHLVIFVVDGSGSMAAQKRMIETKGAILSLLMDCYQKRDQVSLIVFRKEKAELVLPPTRSIEFSLKKLKDMPVGGKTPLSSGLLEAYKLIKRVARKSPETRFILLLITDGRANQTILEMPVWEEIERVVGLFNDLPFTDFIVIDTENKKGYMKTGLALKIALLLRASYYTVENIKSEFITELVQIHRKENFKDQVYWRGG